eukprot:871536-Amphidinium_carterae.1
MQFKGFVRSQTGSEVGKKKSTAIAQDAQPVHSALLRKMPWLAESGLHLASNHPQNAHNQICIKA